MPTQQSHTYRIRTSQRTDQKCGKSVPAHPREKFNFFLPSLRCFNFFATHNRHENSWAPTAKNNGNSDFTRTEDRRPACNSVYVAIAGEVVNRRSVLLRNLVLNGRESASNPLLHIHANRWLLYEKTEN